VLICNGPSAADYKPPPGAYVICINGGFRYHRADAAFSADCPLDVKRDWEAWTGYRIGTEHNPWYRGFEELIACEDLFRQYHSSTPAVLQWAAAKGFRKLTIAGMDAIYNGGTPRGDKHYTPAGHIKFLALFASRFPEGLWIHHAGKEVRVDDTFLGRLGRFQAANRTYRAGPGGAPAQAAPAPCSIPQELVEFDLCSDCTRRCEFCAPGIPEARRKKKLRLDPKRHKAAVDGLAAAHFAGTVCYAGHGEPLLHPELLPMLRYAREALPAATLCIYTNGDKLTAQLLSALGVLLDYVVFDNYDDTTGRKVYAATVASTVHPDKVRCFDHVGRKVPYSSRCGTVREAEPLAEPCEAPAHRLFMSADGHWRLCCEDYGWKTKYPGRLTPEKLNTHKPFRRVVDALARGERSAAGGVCTRCERTFGAMSPQRDAHPRLVDIDRLQPKATWPKVRKTYKRLVVLPCCMCSQGVDQVPAARLVLDAIDRLSVVRGQTLLLWNDPEVKVCPAELRGDAERRQVWEYDRALGWAGINYGIGEALTYAVRNKYDAVIKMDAADAVPLVRGWDAYLLEKLDSGEITGYVQMRPERWADRALGSGPPGPDGERLAELAWAADYCAQGLYHDEWAQGGCYVLGRKAIEHMAATVGMPTNAEAHIGEDRAFSARAQVLQIPVRAHPRVMSYFSREWAYHLDIARYYRDKRGVAVIHPVRDLETVKTLLAEAGA
jgi:hypothetical protein